MAVQSSKSLAQAYQASDASWRKAKRVAYSEELADEILERIASGETLVEIIGSDPGRMPCHSHFYGTWLKVDGFEARYWDAREQQAYLWVDIAMQLSRAPIDDSWRDEVRDGQTVAAAQQAAKRISGLEMQQRKLCIDTYKWFATKIAPRLAEARKPSGGKDDPIQVEVRDMASKPAS